MLEFERVVKAEDSNVAIYVFNDPERGHTIYSSHTGTMVVVEKDKPQNGKLRAAGFAISETNCAGCDGC